MGKLDTTIDTFLKKVADQINELNQVVTHNQTVNAEVQKRAENFVTKSEDSQKQFSAVTIELAKAADSLGLVIGRLEKVSEAFSLTIGSFATSQIKAANSLESTTRALGNSTEALDKAGQHIENSSTAILSSAQELSTSTSAANDALAALPERHQSVLKVFFDEFTQHLSNYTSSMNRQMEEFSEQLVGSSNHRIDEWTSQTQQFCNNMKDAVEFLNGTITEMSTLSSKKGNRS